MIKLTTCFILWCVFSFYEGKREAYYYSLYPSGNIHWLYFIQRGLVALIIMVLLNQNILVETMFIGALIGVFSFIHDGAYYSQRNNINKQNYPLRWKSNSTDSTAILEFTYLERGIYFIIGVSLFIFSLIWAH